MSETLTRPKTMSIAQRITTSHGTNGTDAAATAAAGSGAATAAVWALSLSLAAGYSPTYPSRIFLAFAETDHLQAALAGVASLTDGYVLASTREMAAALKSKGLPIAALADVLDVERKTIYSWLDDGVDANPPNYERLSVVHKLLDGETDGTLRFYHRFWERSLPGGGSLKDLLFAVDLDEVAIVNALTAMRPAVARATQADAERKDAAYAKAAGSSLTLNLRVVT